MKTLTKHISCECKCEFDARKCNSDQSWNNDKSRCEYKKRHLFEKDYIWNPATCSCENDKYLESIMDDSAIRCNQIIEEETKAVTTIFNEKNAICKRKNFYILLSFFLITIALLIAVSIYCYLIIYKTKQKHLLPFYITNNELKEVLY